MWETRAIYFRSIWRTLSQGCKDESQKPGIAKVLPQLAAHESINSIRARRPKLNEICFFPRFEADGLHAITQTQTRLSCFLFAIAIDTQVVCTRDDIKIHYIGSELFTIFLESEPTTGLIANKRINVICRRCCCQILFHSLRKARNAWVTPCVRRLLCPYT